MTDWDQRQLCPDGACIGVIGSDGTCKVCGRVAPNWGDERKRGLADVPDDDDDDDEDDEEGAGDAPVDRGPGASTVGEWDERALCPDGGCNGVIGDDGKCKTCGRSAA